MEGLQKLEGYVRRHIGKQVRLRLTPEIRFVQDDSIERSERIFKLLDQVRRKTALFGPKLGPGVVVQQRNLFLLDQVRSCRCTEQGRFAGGRLDAQTIKAPLLLLLLPLLLMGGAPRRMQLKAVSDLQLQHSWPCGKPKRPIYTSFRLTTPAPLGCCPACCAGQED